MRVGVVTSSYPVADNLHAGIFVQNQVRAMSHLGASCTVFRPGPASYDAHNEPAERLVEIPVTKDGPGSFLSSGFPEAFQDAPLQASWHLSRLILNASIRIRRASNELDWLLAHWAIPSGLASLAAQRSVSKKRRPRLALWCHSSDVYALERIPDGGRIARLLFESADQIWAVSHDLKQRILQRTGSDRLKVDVLHPGIPLGAPPTPALSSGPLRAVFVGRLEEIKGLLPLVDLFVDHPKWTLTLVGNGTQEARLQERARGATNVQILGALRPDKVRAQLDEHHVLLLPGSRDTSIGGRSEGLPTVILEAFAAGRPVVAGDQGGVSEIVDDSVGFLVDRGDISAISDCLGRLDRERSLISRLGEHARKRAELFDCEHVAAQIMRSLSRLN